VDDWRPAVGADRNRALQVALPQRLVILVGVRGVHQLRRQAVGLERSRGCCPVLLGGGITPTVEDHRTERCVPRPEGVRAVVEPDRGGDPGRPGRAFEG
jgi:hypothetical protein